MHRVRHALPLLVALTALVGCTPTPDEWARAKVIARLDEAIGGPKALARPGDFLLENDRVRVAILAARDADDPDAPRNSMGPGLFGGSIIDADLQWHDPRFTGGRGRDQFAELFPTVSMNVHRPTEPDDVRIVADGSDGGPAIVRVTSSSAPFLELLKPLWAVVRQPETQLITDYIAEPGKPWITLETTVYFGWDGQGEPPVSEPMGSHEETLPVIEWAMETGAMLGDFYLSGGSVNVFGPGMGFHEDGAVEAARERGENLFLAPFRFDFLAGIGDGVSYGLVTDEGAAFIPLFTASQTAVIGAGRAGDGSTRRFPDGTALSYRRHLVVGSGDVGAIVDGYVAVRDLPHGVVRGNVIEEGTGFSISGADVLVFERGAEAPWSQWRTDVDPRDDVPDGSFGGKLPVGSWEVMVHREGRPSSARMPITVREGETLELALSAPRAGLVSFTVRDERDRFVPAKITLFTADGASTLNPVFGDRFVGGGPSAVAWTIDGQGQLELPDGRYYAVATRGLEYELDISPVFEVSAATRTHLELQVLRSLDTEGWISADLHVHSAPSHDSGVSRPDRVRTMVAEGVEFFAATDHDFISDFAPTIEAMGLTQWVQSAPGNETTTIEIGHFLGFPMAEDFTGDAGGAFDWTGLAPDEILDALYDAGSDAGFDPLLFVAHPRAGILGYFDQYGFDPYGGLPGIRGAAGTPRVVTPTLGFTNPLLRADLFTLQFDALEIMGTKDLYMVRTATQRELERFAAEGTTTMYDILERTPEEQRALQDGTYALGAGQWGQVDDWFTLLNLGFRLTALANSDTHGWTDTEAGCPRNYVVSSTDDPAFIDDQEIADAIRAHRVVATYGPFVQLWVDGHGIGSEVVPDDATVKVRVEVQAPTWMDVDRVELYRNGELIEVIPVTIDDDPNRLHHEVDVTLEGDAWFVAIAMGDRSMEPLFTPVEIPYIPLDAIVIEALSGVDSLASLLPTATPLPRKYPIYPYGLTNPVWVDLAGDGFDAPGVPSWMRAATR